MRKSDNKLLSGYEFATEVIKRNRFRAGDCLVAAERGECQWLEFKAVVRIGIDDEAVQYACRERGMSEKDACDCETKLNLERIGKSILALHNTRGGCVLIGVCEKNGMPMPTAYSKSKGTVQKKNFLSRVSKYLHVLFRCVLSIIKDLRSLRRLNSLYELRVLSDENSPQLHVCMDSLFERKIVFYRGIPIVALVVNCVADQNEVVLCSYSRDCVSVHRLIYRVGADNVSSDWPLVVNERNAFEETWNDARGNDDLYQKMISLSYSALSNPVMRILDRIVRFFDRGFVASAAAYVLSPVSQDKLHGRLRVSFLYYGFYFLLLNALLLFFPEARLILLIAMMVGLVISMREMTVRAEGLKLSMWAFIPSGLFILLSLVAPLSPWMICCSSIGLLMTFCVLSFMLESPRLSNDNESVLSQTITLFVYVSVLIAQFPFVLFAISESDRSVVGNYILAFIVNVLPVIPSIVASRTAIIYYDGCLPGCIMLFYLPYILLFLSSVISYSSEIVVVPKRFRALFAWLCEKVIFLSLLGMFYMIIVSCGAIKEASSKKRWDKESQERRILVAGKGKKRLESSKPEGNAPKEALTINDYFAQAFASYYFCHSNEVQRILARYDGSGGEVSNRRYKTAVERHYKGLKSIEYSFFGIADEEDIADGCLNDDDYLGDFLSDRRLCVDDKIGKLFLEYIDTVRQTANSSGCVMNDVRNSFDSKANEIRQRLFELFEAMELKIDWRYIEWINRPRQ